MYLSPFIFIERVSKIIINNSGAQNQGHFVQQREVNSYDTDFVDVPPSLLLVGMIVDD